MWRPRLPPRRQYPLYSLPTELVLCFPSFLEQTEYPPIISASYHFLYVHGLMPYLPAPRLQRLLARLRWPLRSGSSAQEKTIH